jgi:hypothetical protein
LLRFFRGSKEQIKKGESGMFDTREAENPLQEATDAVKTKLAAEFGGRPSLLSRLYNRRSHYQQMIRRINNSIEVLEKNQQIAEIVEIVLLSEQKADGPIF